jgi:hypothetical protein
MIRSLSVFLFCFIIPFAVYTQNDTLPPAEEEDFSMYENLDFADAGAKRYCTPKVLDLSPAKLISVGFDYQGAFDIDYGRFTSNNTTWEPATGSFTGSSGLRVMANIPVIAKTNIVWQAGFNYARTQMYTNQPGPSHPLHQSIAANGLTTAGLLTTIFKPFNEKSFLVAQASADLNGDYGTSNVTPLRYTRYSAALIYGKKKHDRKMIGFGLSRTYRVGEINYVPVMLLNWTAPSRKWGVEMLAPARVHVRKTISPRNILLFGYEMEGNSYRVLRKSLTNENLELRRSELRVRAIWETSIYKFIWLSVQAGYRHGLAFDMDRYADDKEFFRGFTGDQPYAQENTLNGTWYAQVSINLVSP